jgi:uncharacterized protein YfaS (alpha-2-macroglobulin family)
LALAGETERVETMTRECRRLLRRHPTEATAAFELDHAAYRWRWYGNEAAAQRAGLELLRETDGAGEDVRSLAAFLESARARRPARCPAVDGAVPVHRVLRCARGGETVRRVRAGEELTLQVEMTCAGDEEELALVVPLPGGCAVLSPDEGTGAFDGFRAVVRRFRGGVAVYVSDPPAGRRRVTFRLKAVFPGEYTLLPAEVRAVHAPWHGGASGADRLTIVP